MGELEVADLEASLSDLWWRHEGLRSSFETIAGEPRQKTGRQPLTLARIDFSGEPDAEQRAMDWAAAESRRPFDLAHGPLMRATLLTQADRDHLLVLVFHHIVIDGWSIGILCKELGEIYSSRRVGRDCNLSELPLQYADYAIWQKDWLLGDTPRRQMQYWKEQLAGMEPLELATDRPRPAVQTFQGECAPFEIPVALTTALRKLSRREGVTLFMTLLAGLKILMARYTGRYDIPIGSPVANRTRPELEGLIGFFVNTLVLRTELNPAGTARDLLRRVRSVCLGAWAQQELAFDKLVEELQPERDLSRPPLFQVLFSLQNAPESGVHLEGVEASLIPLSTGTAKLDLNVTLAEDEGRLLGTLEYNTDLFDRVTIEHLIGHYRNVLESIAANPDQCVADVALLGSTERTQIALWNQTRHQFSGSGVVELFEEQARRTPTAPAVQLGYLPLSYAELNGRANQLAHYLQELGAGRGMPRRDLSGAVAGDGNRAAGRAQDGRRLRAARPRVSGRPAGLHGGRCGYRDPAHREGDTRTDSGAGGQGNLPGCRLAAHCGSLGRQPPARHPSEQLAYLIYTSGSTGKPKGAMITHGGLSNYLQWAAENYRVGEGTGSAVHSSLSFDLTVTSLYVPLLAGKTVHLLEPGAGVDELADVLRQSRGLSR